ncbi:hypothetical protein G7Y31_01990 [Corynebacterium lizhenjunii]|uniref:Putative oxidoreductase/dehydrogenase Rossmann-like domain-containing protein n=1 Tax=Corynebacterium lizhenjunii TaxID=2709394 RepID=A0A7T0KEV4_9CORY|nr:hypothetical protein [Corynebacterium lizhenjunii]QPK79505.1 hypothetical protein G7Y31_01990 [Corynebacterium lizhenjunii]
MRIATVGGSALAYVLLNSGHELVEDLDSAECIILQADHDELPTLVEEVAPHVSKGDIVIHTSLTHGPQVLDPVEVRGAVVASAAQLRPDTWGVEALDEVGLTVAQVLISDSGGNVIELSGDTRGPLIARVAYSNITWYLAAWAEMDVVQEIRGVDVPLLPEVLPGEIREAYRYIEDIGQQQAYSDVVRLLTERGKLPDFRWTGMEWQE